MSQARILIVDDRPRNLKLASEVLAFEGYEILQAADAESARDLVDTNPPDLILMDIALPGMDGLTLTRLLKADDKTSHIPIIAVTAFAMRGDEAKARASGCDGYISKPIDIHDLVLQVAQILSSQSGLQQGVP